MFCDQNLFRSNLRLHLHQCTSKVPLTHSTWVHGHSPPLVTAQMKQTLSIFISLFPFDHFSSMKEEETRWAEIRARPIWDGVPLSFTNFWGKPKVRRLHNTKVQVVWGKGPSSYFCAPSIPWPAGVPPHPDHVHLELSVVYNACVCATVQSQFTEAQLLLTQAIQRGRPMTKP